jgi:hypothetical protein
MLSLQFTGGFEGLFNPLLCVDCSTHTMLQRNMQAVRAHKPLIAPMEKEAFLPAALS